MRRADIFDFSHKPKIGDKMKKYFNVVKLILPIIAVLISISTYYGFDDNGKQKATEYPYYVYFMLIVLGIYLIFEVASIFLKKLRIGIIHKAPLIAGVILFLTAVNVITTKTTILPTLYFPSLDRIIGLIYEQKKFLLENVFCSLKLLATGFICGASVGFFTGLALGYSPKVGYWLNPVTKFIGPIPTTAWIPLALSVFPTTQGANIFLIAFAVWFLVTLMTSSGKRGAFSSLFLMYRKGEKMDYKIKTTTEEIDFNEVRDILHYHKLSNYDIETIKKIFENSYAVIFLLENKKVIGISRAISDGVCQVALYNIALDKEHCGLGLGKVIVTELLKQVKGCNVILYKHPKHVRLYEHWVFSRMKTGYALFFNREFYKHEGFI